MSGEESPGSLEVEGVEALRLMETALSLLDRCDGAEVPGAHLDLAICRLRDVIAAPSPPDPV